MTPERFLVLLDAYGADLRRWPASERASARALIEQDLPELRRRLAEAAALDGWLDAHEVAAPEDALARRVIAGAATSRLPPAASRRPRRHKRWWWPGAGLVGAGLAGTLAGAFVVSLALRSVVPPADMEWPGRATAFSDPSADWSEE